MERRRKRKRNDSLIDTCTRLLHAYNTELHTYSKEMARHSNVQGRFIVPSKSPLPEVLCIDTKIFPKGPAANNILNGCYETSPDGSFHVQSIVYIWSIIPRTDIIPDWLHHYSYWNQDNVIRHIVYFYHETYCYFQMARLGQHPLTLPAITHVITHCLRPYILRTYYVDFMNQDVASIIESYHHIETESSLSSLYPSWLS